MSKVLSLPFFRLSRHLNCSISLTMLSQLPFLASFTSLKLLNLSHNSFSGTVPDALKNLPRITTIDISYNKLSGAIPLFGAGVRVLYVGNYFAAEKESRKSRHLQVLSLTIIILALCLMIAILVFYLFVILSQERPVNNVDAELGNSDPTRKTFTYREMKIATNDFDQKRRIGNGASSVIYLGSLNNGNTRVAVKRLHEGASEKVLESEVNILRCAHHSNVVTMVGHCDQSPHRLIVYEYMEKGSLEKWIFRANTARERSLTWHEKRKIIKQIAMGILYLQQECIPDSRILHLDIKPENVLLDSEFNAKVSDLGLAKILSNDRLTTSDNGGTRGYMDPETYRRGRVSVKSDVYSYGVVVLETVYEERFWACSNEEALIEKVKRKVQAGELMDLLGENMLEFESEIEKITKLSLWCLNISEPLQSRPSMAEVLQVLEGTATIPENRIDYST